MSITRISAADLGLQAREFTPDELARLDCLSEEDIETAAARDADARPATSDMLRRAQAHRRQRLARDRLAAEQLGASLSLAAPDLDLPVWEVTDENGRIVHIKAADVRRVDARGGGKHKVLKIEASASGQATAPKRRPVAAQA